jgi:hypothetical protein
MRTQSININIDYINFKDEIVISLGDTSYKFYKFKERSNILGFSSTIVQSDRLLYTSMLKVFDSVNITYNKWRKQ